MDQRSRCLLVQPCTEHSHNSPLSVTPPTIHPMEKLPGELMIFGFLSPTLVTTYDTILYDMPFEEQFRLIEGLSSCQDVCKQWRSIADENPALFSREYCITAASKELMSRGPHIKRLVVLLPPHLEKSCRLRDATRCYATLCELTAICDQLSCPIRPSR